MSKLHMMNQSLMKQDANINSPSSKLNASVMSTNSSHAMQSEDEDLRKKYKELLRKDANSYLTQDQETIMTALQNKQFYDYEKNRGLVLSGHNFEQCCLILGDINSNKEDKFNLNSQKSSLWDQVPAPDSMTYESLNQ